MILSLDIVYEDSQLLVINKPSGMVVNRSETVKSETIQDWVEKGWPMADKRCPPAMLRQAKRAGKIEKTSEFAKRSGIVHRLDRDTSGLLIIAKNTEAFSELQRQFKEREIEKRYLALVSGEVKPEKGKIEAPITRNPFNREKFGVFLGGRQATTEYTVLGYYRVRDSKNKEIVSLVDVFPKTGRTHQIRVHFKHLNYSLVSDKIYAGRRQLQKDLKWCPRLFLHAYYLKFKQPKTGKELTLKIGLAEDLSRVLKKLEGNKGEKEKKGEKR